MNPRPSPGNPLTVDLALAAGTPLVLLGLLLGPGIGVLERPELRALAPVTALGVGWIGAVFGSRFEWRYVRRIPRRVLLLVGIQAFAVAVAVALAAWLFTRLSPALQSAWSPTLPAVLTLGAVASISGPGAVALVARAVGVRRAVAKTLGRTAALDTACGAAAFTLALALYHPREPGGGGGGGGGASLSWYAWLAVAIASGALVGLLFLGLARLRSQRGELGLSLLGVLLLGAGVGYAAGLSPFVVCAFAGVVIVNFSPQRRQVLALLRDWAHPIYAVFLIIAGALIALPTAWLLIAVPVLGALRVVAKWAVVRYGRQPLRVAELPPHLGLAAVAQGGVAVALGINFFMTYVDAAPGPAHAMVTTVLLGETLAQVAAPTLMGRALRVPRLTRAGAAVELSVNRHFD